MSRCPSYLRRRHCWFILVMMFTTGTVGAVETGWRKIEKHAGTPYPSSGGQVDAAWVGGRWLIVAQTDGEGDVHVKSFDTAWGPWVSLGQPKRRRRPVWERRLLHLHVAHLDGVTPAVILTTESNSGFEPVEMWMSFRKGGNWTPWTPQQIGRPFGRPALYLEDVVTDRQGHLTLVWFENREKHIWLVRYDGTKWQAWERAMEFDPMADRPREELTLWHLAALGGNPPLDLFTFKGVGGPNPPPLQMMRRTLVANTWGPWEVAFPSQNFPFHQFSDLYPARWESGLPAVFTNGRVFALLPPNHTPRQELRIYWSAFDGAQWAPWKAIELIVPRSHSLDRDEKLRAVASKENRIDLFATIQPWNSPTTGELWWKTLEIDQYDLAAEDWCYVRHLTATGDTLTIFPILKNVGTADFAFDPSNAAQVKMSFETVSSAGARKVFTRNFQLPISKKVVLKPGDTVRLEAGIDIPFDKFQTYGSVGHWSFAHSLDSFSANNTHTGVPFDLRGEDILKQYPLKACN